ncbi:hypothetical protein [Tannerella forsythia]|uniref:hypothetical protein n=1 Tax=Tannerella forsythia TaxID=28112 RepID=UPI00241FE220|nr:hypothetical protein [Tannerella forsythia]
MNKIISFLISMGCLFTFSQCDMVENPNDETPIVPPSDYTKIAFLARITDGSSVRSLCTMDKSGGGLRKIVDKTVACQKPVCSHSRTKLLFASVNFKTWTNPDNSVGMSSEYGLYIVNTDGTGLSLINHIGPTEAAQFGHLAWSPDDKQIAYVKYSGEGFRKHDLILYNMTENTRQSLKTKGDICTMSFSPDGKYMAYCASTEACHSIYKMDISGGNSQLIIHNGSSPKWSPQGDKIVYSAQGSEGEAQLFIADSDGRNQKQLTFTVSPRKWPGWPPHGNQNPQWTPDGRKIVYVSWENAKPEIFIMNVDGSKQTRLTKAEYRDENPEITPDGQSILFSSRRTDMMDFGIVMMSLDGSNQKVLSRSGNYPVVCK